MSFFASVRLYEDLDVICLALVSVIAFTASLVITPTAMVMSSLFDISAKFPRNIAPRIQELSDMRMKEISTRELKSCPLIRCQVGNMYHMEAKAKMTMLHNIVNGVVFLMVNGPK